MEFNVHTGISRSHFPAIVESCIILHIRIILFGDKCLVLWYNIIISENNYRFISPIPHKYTHKGGQTYMTNRTGKAKNTLSIRVLKTGLPLIFLTLCYIAVCALHPAAFLDTAQTAHRACVMMLEHTLMSLCLIIGGSALCGYLEKQG